MAQFMLLIRGGDDATRDYTPELYQHKCAGELSTSARKCVDRAGTALPDGKNR